jgi:hypothetical protein
MSGGRRPSLKTRWARLRSDAPDLATLVDDGRLVLSEAEAAAAARAQARLRKEQERSGPQPGDAWRRCNLPVPGTPDDERAYCLYVLAHSPGLATMVVHGD